MQKRPRAGLMVLAAIVPVVLYSSASGPIIRVSGAPGDGTCNQEGCHTGPDVNTAGGSVVLTSPSGTFYTPGQKLLLTLKITDSKAKVYGFQMSARLDGNPINGQAGTFTEDSQQKVLCDNSILRNDSKGCPSIYPVEFIEHNAPYQPNTINVTWTPPATDAGPVTLYVAANAANGDGTNAGDHIYTASLQLVPPPKAPAISPNGVVRATAFRPNNAGPAAGTLLEIYGANLASTTRAWQTSDFKANQAPTSLDQVSATIGGRDAFVAYVSPGQVNLEVPDGVPVGPGVPLVLRNSAGSSPPYLLAVSAVAPAILAPAYFSAKGTQYAVAILPDMTYAAPVNSIPGVTSRPAKPGEVIVLYGIGFGPVTPASPAGMLATGSTTLAPGLQASLGQTTAVTQYAGLAPGYTGLYQINVQVPQLPPGDYPLTLQLGTLVVSTGASITVGL
jgi:uncharacterized protein (TIGR03437 family)